jgi:hypothetical protein
VRGGGGERPVRSPGSSQVDEDKTDTTCNMHESLARACSHTGVIPNSSVLRKMGRLTSSTHALPDCDYSDQTCSYWKLHTLALWVGRALSGMKWVDNKTIAAVLGPRDGTLNVSDCVMVELMMNNELDSIWKEAVMAPDVIWWYFTRETSNYHQKVSQYPNTVSDSNRTPAEYRSRPMALPRSFLIWRPHFGFHQMSVPLLVLNKCNLSHSCLCYC